MQTECLKKEQYMYIASIGGYLNLQESDTNNNDMNRAIIKAFKEENKTAFLGVFNLRDETYQNLNNGVDIDVLKEYNGEMVYNFEADFIIPSKDETLEILIKKWNTKSSNKSGILDSIHERIEELGGILFIWS